MNDKLYCLYTHINPFNKEVFYIGIGSLKRPYDKSQRSKWWKRIVEKYGYKIHLIEYFNDWKEACEREKYWIKKIGRKDLKEGTLINMTNGGDGVVGNFKELNHFYGKKHTEDSLLKMSNIKIGKKAPEETKVKMSNSQKGKVFSEETRQKISNSKKGKPSNVKGTKMSDEHKYKIGKANGKKIINSNGKIFDTIGEASNEYGIKRQTLNSMLKGQNPNKTDLKYL